MRTLDSLERPNISRLSNFRREMPRPTTQNGINGKLLFRIEADNGTDSRVTEADSQTLDARYLKAFEKKRCPQKESTAAHENADSKQTQPGSELKLVRASLADLP
jgi:hypothetical protein